MVALTHSHPVFAPHKPVCRPGCPSAPALLPCPAPSCEGHPGGRQGRVRRSGQRPRAVCLAARTDAAFKAFLDAQNPRQQHSATLESYLIKPIQRVLKYPLLLRELFALTHVDSEEHYHLDGEGQARAPPTAPPTSRSPAHGPAHCL